MSRKERITNRITKYYVALHSRLYNTWHDIASKFSMSLCPENMDKNKNVKQRIKEEREREGKRSTRIALLTTGQAPRTFVPSLECVL